jgi:hypothetical protein
MPAAAERGKAVRSGGTLIRPAEPVGRASVRCIGAYGADGKRQARRRARRGGSDVARRRRRDREGGCTAAGRSGQIASPEPLVRLHHAPADRYKDTLKGLEGGVGIDGHPL